jgi:alkylhydroperoxidase/carboxymuconolactone decarboxylase family protein YurZ
MMTEKGREILASVEAKRGYTLPYHRMMAASAPDLLAAYDAFYEQLTLVPRVLTAVERETVWAGLLAAAREVHGSIHMTRAEKAGMDRSDILRAVAIAAVAEAWEVFSFSGEHWAAWARADEVEQRYLDLFEAARGDLAPKLAHLVALVCHGASRREKAMLLHLRGAFEAGIQADEVAEGLSYMIIPCGGNTLIEAVHYWEKAAKAGLVPSPS